MRRIPEVRNRRAAVIFLMAILLPVLLMFIGHAVDLARMQQVSMELRAATDMAAKSASMALSDTGTTAQAIAAGKSVAVANQVAGAGLILNDGDFVFGRSTRDTAGRWNFVSGQTPFNSVRVRGSREAGSAGGAVPLVFSGMFGVTSYEPVATATSSFIDVDVCLVLDRSSSMKLQATDPSTGGLSTSDPRFCQAPQAGSRWRALETAVNQFVATLSNTLANEHAAVVTFASNYTSCSTTNVASKIDLQLTGNLSLVNTTMQSRSSSVWNGNTDIAAGINSGKAVLTGANARPLAEKIMIVLTDGVYTAANPVPAAIAARDAGITVHTITFGAGANQTDMQSVASAGHGDHYHAPDVATLEAAFQRIAGSLSILTE